MKSKITHLTRYAAAALCCVSVFACNDLKELEDRVDSLENRVTAIETQIPALNENLEAISELMDGAKFITGITAVDGSENEYTITMSDGESYTIVQGQVGNTPLIAVDEEGYWVVDYEGDGTFVRITEGGAEDGLTIAAVPQFQVSAEGNWQISTDGGNNWVDVLDTGGQKVPALAEGSDFFKDIAYDEETGELTFTLSDGQTYTFTVSSDFVCQILDSDGNQLTGTVTFTAGISKEFNVRMRGVSDVYIQKPDGWKATLEDIDASGTEEVTAVLTVTPPASVADAGTLQTKVSADSDSDLVLHATAAASDRSIFAKMTVEVEAATNVPQAAITAGEVTESNVSFTVTPNSNVTSWKYMLLPASEEAPADAAAFDTRATTVEGSEEKVLTLDKDADGTALVAGTEYTLYVLAINTVGEVDVTSISSASATPMYDTYYAAYEAGMAITIAGKTYSRTVFGAGQLISATSEDIDLSTYISGKDNAILFLEQSGEHKFYINANTAISGNIALISNVSENPATFNQDGKYIAIRSGSLAFKDIVIERGTSATYLTNNNSATATADAILFDGCQFKEMKNPIFAISGNSTSMAIKNIGIVNSSIELTGTSNIQFFNLGACTALNTVEKITFENNIVYSSSGNASNQIPCQIFSYNNNTAQSDGNTTISVCNNTFYNVPGQNGYIRFYHANEMKMQNNIFYSTQTSGSQASYCFASFSESQSADAVVVSENIAYGLPGNWTIAINSSSNKSTVIPNPNNIAKSDTDPLAVKDTESGTFTQASGFENYGAQR